MRAYRGESPPVWAAYVYIGMAAVLGLGCCVMAAWSIGLAVCMESPVCRAEQDYRWAQERAADQIKYDRRMSELSKSPPQGGEG